MLDSATTVPRPARLISDVQSGNGAILIQTRPTKGPAYFLSLWLIGWTVGCVFLLFELITEPSLGTACFAVPFFVSWFAVAAFLIWLWFGREAVLIKDDEVLFRRTAIIDLTTRRIPVAEVSDVRSCRSTHTENDEHLLGIEMTCLGKPLRFAYRLPDQERAWLIQEIESVLPLVRGSEARFEDQASLEIPNTPSNFESKCLTPENTLDQPPSDSCWQITQLPNETSFHRRGEFSIVGFLIMGFICLFWNGIVSVFILGLLGLMPGENGPMQGGEWWGMFFFLIPFEVIGLAFLLGWLAIILAPFSSTTIGIRDQAVIRIIQWPFFQKRKSVNCLDVAQIHLRKADKARGNSMNPVPSTETFQLAFVSHKQEDLISFNQLSRGDALWIAGELLQFEESWAR